MCALGIFYFNYNSNFLNTYTRRYICECVSVCLCSIHNSHQKDIYLTTPKFRIYISFCSFTIIIVYNMFETYIHLKVGDTDAVIKTYIYIFEASPFKGN